jgi:hypothetical protein
LENNIVTEDMLDASNDVFNFTLGEIDRRRGFEYGSQMGEFWYSGDFLWKRKRVDGTFL